MNKLIISKSDIEKTMRAREVILSQYVKKERELIDLFSQNPSNTDVSVVMQKIGKLNAAYATRIPSSKMAEHIVADVKDIDSRLAAGDPTVVHQIAQLDYGDKMINYFSFATKYCSFHNPSAYPIFDSLVYEVLKKLRNELDCDPIREDAFKDKMWNGKKDCGYALYKKVYDRFITLYAVEFAKKDYRTIDHYIWSSRKIAKQYDKKSETSKDIIANAINTFMQK